MKRAKEYRRKVFVFCSSEIKRFSYCGSYAPFYSCTLPPPQQSPGFHKHDLLFIFLIVYCVDCFIAEANKKQCNELFSSKKCGE